MTLGRCLSHDNVYLTPSKGRSDSPLRLPCYLLSINFTRRRNKRERWRQTEEFTFKKKWHPKLSCPDAILCYLKRKNVVPEQYSDYEAESKGFYKPVIPSSRKEAFPESSLYFKDSEYINRKWRMATEDSRITQGFTSFLKELYYPVSCKSRDVVWYWRHSFRAPIPSSSEWLFSVESACPCTGLATFWKEYQSLRLPW